MLRPIAWAQTYYGVGGNSSKRKTTLHTYAAYSYAALKLLRVSNDRHEVEAYITRHKLKRVILVRFVWDNPESKGETLRGQKRVEYTPASVKRCKFTDTSKPFHYNDLKGQILPDEWDIV